MNMSLEELRERVRQSRIERGLPPESPPQFLPVAHSLALINRCANVYKFLAKYAQLTLDAGQLVKIDVSPFDKYRDDLRLIGMSVDFYCALWGTVVHAALKVVDAVNEDKLEQSNPELVAKRLYQLLRLVGKKPPITDYERPRDLEGELAGYRKK